MRETSSPSTALSVHSFSSNDYYRKRVDAPAGPPHLGTPYHVGMVVHDLDAAKAELSALLGTRWAKDTSPALVVRADGQELRVRLRVALTIEGGPHIELLQQLGPGPWRAPKVHHLGFFVDDVAATEAALVGGHGFVPLVEHVAEPGEEPRWCYLRNPNGLAFELVHRSMEQTIADRVAGRPPFD